MQGTLKELTANSQIDLWLVRVWSKQHYTDLSGYDQSKTWSIERCRKCCSEANFICLNDFMTQKIVLSRSEQHSNFSFSTSVPKRIQESIQRADSILTMYRKRTQELIKGSLLFLGGLCMISTSAGLKPRAVAGRPSVTKLTQRSWTGIRHSGIPNAAVKKMEITSPTLDDIMYL